MSGGDEEQDVTATLSHDSAASSLDVAARLAIGLPDGTVIETAGPKAIVGALPGCEVHLIDSTVSRRHAELSALANGILVVDLDSKNGTRVGGVRVKEALLQDGDQLEIGALVLRVAKRRAEPSSAGTARFGGYLTANRKLAAELKKLERVAAGDSTVLIEGETGTGKEVLAHAIHDASPRSKKPFVVVDLGSVTPSLLESQLFGHKKGAFTGAIADQAGAFEAAEGGTVFLDELGELPLDLQPKLLRVLEAKTVRPLGSNQDRPIDVRVVAATHRDLERAVREQKFRADLFYRVAVVRVTVPPLRERLEDVPLLVDRFVAALGPHKKVSPQIYTLLAGYDWPGNARELRNVIERAIAVSEGRVIDAQAIFPDGGDTGDTTFHEAKETVIAAFEKRYVEALIHKHEGNISRAAKEAGLSRNALYALMRRSGISADLNEPST